MLVLFIIVCLVAMFGAFISSNINNDRLFTISTIVLIVSTIICVGKFNIVTISAIVGEIYWLHFVYKRKYDVLNDSIVGLLADSLFQLTTPFIVSLVSLLITAHAFVAKLTQLQCVREFFLL